MMKHIRIALAALLIAFAIAFSASQLGGFTWMSSDTAGGIKITAGSGSVKPAAGVKPPKGVVALRFIDDPTGLPFRA
jgi:hypothetical protein